MKDTKYSFRKKMTAWILSICLVVTLLPEFAFATVNISSEDSESRPEEEVTMQDIVQKTESTTTYDIGGGQKMSVFHGGQVRFEDRDGELTDYNPSLVKIGSGNKTGQNESLKGYSYTNKTGDKRHYIPKTITEDTPVRMEYRDYAIEFSLTDESTADLGISDKQVKVEEETIQTAYDDYAELPVNAVYEGGSVSALTYTSTEDSIKETLVLNSKPDSNVFRYHISLTGMYAKKNITDGGITYYDEKTGEITGDIEVPWMNDATGEAYSEDITYELEETEEDGEYILTMTVDEAYIQL